MQTIWSNLGDALVIAPNLGLALLFGALIGIERQWRQRYTGLTTHALVSLGAATFSTLPILIDFTSDVRMGGQVVTGIGFLGAGLIMRDGLSVRGLSGAATVWATGAVGMLAGYGQLMAAAEATVFVLLINLILPRLSWLVDRHTPEETTAERYFTIELKCTSGNEAGVRTMLLQALNVRKLRLHGLESQNAGDEGAVEVKALVHASQEQISAVERLVSELSLYPSISSASWTSTMPPE